MARVQPLVGDRLAFLDAEGAHDRVQALAGEDAQQVVLARQEELRVAGVALTAGAAAQLVVDAAAFVALGAQHEQAAGGQGLGLRLRRSRPRARPPGPARPRGSGSMPRPCCCSAPVGQPHVDVAAQLDVGAAAGHVGGDGHRAGHAGVGDDARLPARGSGRSAPGAGCPSASCRRARTRRSSSSSDSSSDFSIETVPTRIGWPRAWQSAIWLEDRLGSSRARCDRPRRRRRCARPDGWSGSRPTSIL